MKSPSALRRERITALTLREPERIAASRPRSAALARRSAEHLLFDVPMHWMSDWARLSHLQAAVRVEAHDSQCLAQLCRYISRPAQSDERAQINAAGQVDLKLKTPRRDGNTNLVMSPLVFVHRLAAPGLARDCPGQGLVPGCQLSGGEIAHPAVAGRPSVAASVATPMPATQRKRKFAHLC